MNALNIAINLYKEGNYKEALKHLDELYNNTSQKYTIEFLTAYSTCLQERLRYSESLKIVNEILEKDPKNKEALLNKVFCFGKQNNHTAALEIYNKILEIDKDYKIQIGYYAYLLERNNNFEKADKFYRIAIEQEPDNDWYLSHFALFLQKIKNFKEAEIYYNKSLNKDPENTWLIKRFVLFKQETNGVEAACKYYDNLIDSDLNNINLYINYAELLLLNKSYDMAFAILKKTIIIDKSLVFEIIISFYYCFYYLIRRNFSDSDLYYQKIKNLLINYKSYIHRDFTEIIHFVNNNFDQKQNELFKQLIKITTNVK